MGKHTVVTVTTKFGEMTSLASKDLTTAIKVIELSWHLPVSLTL